MKTTYKIKESSKIDTMPTMEITLKVKTSNKRLPPTMKTTFKMQMTQSKNKDT